LGNLIYTLQLTKDVEAPLARLVQKSP
jgi:hypothetical protein